MKNKKIIAALVLTLTMGIGATAYADTNSDVAKGNGRVIEKAYRGKDKSQCNKCSAGRLIGKGGYEFKSEALAKKLNISVEELTKLKTDGKSFYEIAKEKGLSDEEYKNVMKEAKMAGIDKAIEEGKITKEQGDEIKIKVEENMKNYIPGQQKVKKEKGRYPITNDNQKDSGVEGNQNNVE